MYNGILIIDTKVNGETRKESLPFSVQDMGKIYAKFDSEVGKVRAFFHKDHIVTDTRFRFYANNVLEGAHAQIRIRLFPNNFRK